MKHTLVIISLIMAACAANGQTMQWAKGGLYDSYGPNSTSIMNIEFYPDGERILVVPKYNYIKVFDLKNERLISLLGETENGEIPNYEMLF
ncbi:MAG: hypothetical protein ACLFQX_01315 [Candidatus Kapaibacterium sp.]